MNFNNVSTLGIILMLIFAVALIVTMPLAVIWALNNLFILNIAYSITTWASVFILGMFVRGNVKVSKD